MYVYSISTLEPTPYSTEYPSNNDYLLLHADSNNFALVVIKKR